MATWTYTLSTSSATLSQKDQVRLLTGQTSSGAPAILYDQEINWILTQQGNVYFAAAEAAESLAGKWTQLAIERKVGALQVKYNEQVNNFRSLSASLRRQGMMRGAQFYVGGQSVAEQITDNQNQTLTQPQFEIGMNDNPPLYGVPVQGGFGSS